MCWAGRPDIPLLVPHCHRSLVCLQTNPMTLLPPQFPLSRAGAALLPFFTQIWKGTAAMLLSHSPLHIYAMVVGIQGLVQSVTSKAAFLFNLPFLFFLFQPFILALPSQGVKTSSQIHTSGKQDHVREICHLALLPRCTSYLSLSFPEYPTGARAKKAGSHHFPWQQAIPCTIARGSQTSWIGWGMSYQKRLFR